MWSLALWIVEGFRKLLEFSDKFRIFNNAKLAFDLLRITSRKVMLIFLASLALTYIALSVAFLIFTIDAVTTAYNIISDLLEQLKSPTNVYSSVLQTFYFIANAYGISTALNAVFPFIASALTFRLLKPIKKVFIELYDRFIKTLLDFSKLITAA